MCAQVFSTMLQSTERRREIISVLIAKGRVRISHLFYADNSLLFCRANNTECTCLQEMLDKYEKASRKKLKERERERKLPYFLVVIAWLMLNVKSC
jgi:hypothetical protein